MTEILIPIAVLGGMGLVFGGLLGVAAKAFHVEKDERIPAVLELLPGANCGGCGKAGCSAMAQAIVDGTGKVNDCPVNSAENAAKIAEIMGVEAEAKEKMVAKVMCAGVNKTVTFKYEYQGLQDCVSASKLANGPKNCEYGCLGMGSCIRACALGALSMVDGDVVTDREKCGGCGACVAVCPKNVIKLVPEKQQVWVVCNSQDKGAVVKNFCTVGCIGCKLCEKNCPSDAIHVENNLASIDYSKCTNCGICVTKCPKKIIHTSMDMSEIEDNIIKKKETIEI